MSLRQNQYFICGLLFRILLLCLLFTALPLISAAEPTKHETAAPDIFAQDNVRIESNQTIGRLLVDHHNAVIAGQVQRGIVIVDGNLLVQNGARIEGPVILLGGQASVEPESYIHHPIYTINPLATPLGWPFTLLLAGLLLCLIPAIIGYTLFRLLQKNPLYSLSKKTFFSLQDRWPKIYILLSLLISALLLALFTELAWKTLFRHQMDFLDNVVIWLVRYFATPGLDQIMIGITTLGSAPFYGVLAVLLMIGLVRSHRWHELAIISICLSGGSLLSFLLKHLFERARPDLFRVISESGYSFPSGHAMISLCFYGLLAFLISRHLSSWLRRLMLFALTFLFVAAIGISRIYLGVHYPTDVLAGYAAGSTWLFFCVSLLMWWEHKSLGGMNNANE